jgi:hypothetical protein
MASQPPAPDTSLRLAKPLDRLALVQHVHGTPALQETAFWEWKSGYDLSEKSGAAKTAKHLIGYANREPTAAARHHGGHAYLLLGVEPGQLPGVPLWDSADIQTWLERFVETELRYDVHYVPLSGVQVLVLEVEPPRAGDPIYALQRTSADDHGNTLQEGTVFVRRPGITAPASAAELKMLQERALASSGPGLSLRLEVDDSQVYALGDEWFDEEFRDKVLDDGRSTMYSEMPRPDPIMGSLAHFAAGETRSPEEFGDELNRFVAQAKERWWPYIAWKHVQHEPSVLRFAVMNETDDNFEDVVVEVQLPLPWNTVHVSAADAKEKLKPPEEPPRWGRRPTLDFDLEPIVGHGSTVEADGDERHVLVRFPPLHARPRTRHDLPELNLTLDPQWLGQTLQASWRATARNTRGDLKGGLEIQVHSQTGDDGATKSEGAADESDGD